MAKPGFYKHWKLYKLMELLGKKKYETIGLLQMLWDGCAIKKKYEHSGNMIEAMAEWDGEPGKLVKAMIEVKLLDDKGGGIYEIHDWREHCPKYILMNEMRKEKEVKEERKVEEKYSVKRLTENIDPYSLNKKEIIEVLLGLDGNGMMNYDYWIKVIVNEYINEEKMYEVMELLKEIKDSRYYSKEKGVSKIDNEKAFIVKRIKEIIKN